MKENVYTKYMGNYEAMGLSTRSFAYSYRQFKKCFVENYHKKKKKKKKKKKSKCNIFLIFPHLHQLFTVLFEMFYSFYST